MKTFLLGLCLSAALLAQTASFPGTVATDSQLKVRKNFLATTLASSIAAADTVLTVRDASRIAANMLLTVDQEIVNVVSKSGNNLTVTRGYDNTTAASHRGGAAVVQYPTAWDTNALAAEVKAIESTLGAGLANVVSLPSLPNVTRYDFTSQAPGGSLASGNNAITMTPIPTGVNGNDVGHYLYVSGGVGTAEACLITGGTGRAGDASGEIIIDCDNTHTGAWTVQSASDGIQEAIVASPGHAVFVPNGTYAVRGTITNTASTSILCESWASIIEADAALGASSDVIHIRPLVGDGFIGTTIQGCYIKPASGTPGRWGIHVELTTHPYYQNVIRQNRIGNFGSGALYFDNSINLTNGIFLSDVDQNYFNSSVKAENLGDSMRFRANRHDGPGPGLNLDIAHLGDNLGASIVTVADGNFYVNGPCVVIRDGNRVILRNNNFECYGTGSNGAQVDVQGLAYPAYDITIAENFFSMIGEDYTHALRLDNATAPRVRDNVFGLGYSPQRGVTCTADTVDLYESGNTLDPTYLTRSYIFVGSCPSARVQRFVTVPQGSVVASASTITPPSSFFHISGTDPISGINLPADYSTDDGREICVVADGAWSMTTSANIATGFTATQNYVYCLFYSNTTAKWHRKD